MKLSLLLMALAFGWSAGAQRSAANSQPKNPTEICDLEVSTLSEQAAPSAVGVGFQMNKLVSNAEIDPKTITTAEDKQEAINAIQSCMKKAGRYTPDESKCLKSPNANATAEAMAFAECQKNNPNAVCQQATYTWLRMSIPTAGLNLATSYPNYILGSVILYTPQSIQTKLSEAEAMKLRCQKAYQCLAKLISQPDTTAVLKRLTLYTEMIGCQHSRGAQ